MSLPVHKSGGRGRQLFQLLLIKPSHYDDDGYVIQWARSYIPSNSVAALYGIAPDCAERRVLGDDVDFRITIMDEMDTRIVPRKLIREFRRSGGRGLVALVGVQSNQFPRAVDIARPLRAAGLPVCIGGFHAAGSLAMLKSLSRNCARPGRWVSPSSPVRPRVASTSCCRMRGVAN